ncbi:MAG: transglycosylase SLT domain-containing protein [Ideonella sp.]|nr:transglycosylase SLT domain-containing protein [Ideonella sp.]
MNPHAKRPSSAQRLTLSVITVASSVLLGACSSLPSNPFSGPKMSSAVADNPRVVATAPGARMLLDAQLPPSEPPVVNIPLNAAAQAAPTPAPVELIEAKPIDPLNPDKPINLQDAEAHTDLWGRVRAGFAMPDFEGDLVRRHEQFYASKPEYVRRMTDRGGRYLFHVMEEINKRNMPSELALLPFIESAFNPQALSTAKASGMWQFIPSTGKDFALKQNIFRDDRRDVLASTRAALDYLERLNKLFNGDWQLALAAYNWGQGNVMRAIARNQRAGLPTDYASLSMPDETRHYIPKLQAVKNIVARPDAFNISLPELQNHPYFLSVPIERDIDVDLAAKLAGVSMEEFKQLNPQMNKPVILAAGVEQVLLPYDNASRFVSNLRAHRGQLASWTAWVAPRTMRTADAAKQVGMSESELRTINRIPPKMLVRAGSTLLVPRSSHKTADVSEHLADNATIALAPDLPPMRKVTLRAGKKGESVASVARRYKTTPAQVAQWNKVSPGGHFKAGSSIVVFVPRSTARGRAVAAKPSGRAVAASHARRGNAKAAPSRTAAKPVRVAAQPNNSKR